MKKRTLLIIGCVMLLCIGWWFVNRQMEYNRSEEVAIEFVNDFYNGIESIEITDTKKIPTGSISVSGYVNHNESFYFSVMVSGYDYSVDSVRESKDFPNPRNGADENGE